MYGNYGMMGGMGGMGMGGMGGGSSQMMSSMMMFCSCSIALAGGAYLLMNNNKPEEPPMPMMPELLEQTTTTGSTMTTGTAGANGLDGSYMIMVGEQSMFPEGACGNSAIYFSNPGSTDGGNMGSTWIIKKAGSTSAGQDFYTLMSDAKSFAQTCRKRYLTAPSGCKTRPFLDIPRSGPQQYWLINGTAEAGYSLQSLACKMGRHTRQFLQTPGQNNKAKQQTDFAARAGSNFLLTPPFE
jgi:hypothetical protein